MAIAKLRTQDKSAAYRTLKAELYKNINDIMENQYTNIFNFDKTISQTDIGLLSGSVSLLGSLYYDAIGGIVGGVGNATFGIIQAGANFANNVYDIFV